MKKMRDDFTEEVKRTIAFRVGYRCSNPDCRALTCGPQIDNNKALNVGVAAHISAASPGGPRYNSLLTPEERKDVNNAIWLCQTCAKLVDNDEKRFTEFILREWKHRAELEALSSIGKTSKSEKASIVKNDEWIWLNWEGKFLSFNGPIENLKLIEDCPYQQSMLDALSEAGFETRWGAQDRLSNHIGKGYRIIYLTDRKQWRQKIVYSQINHILLAKPIISKNR